MAITAKPTGYTVNTGHAKCPDHLWMFDEGAGTSVADQGKGAALALTLDNADMWGVDGGGLGAIISTNESGPRIAPSATGTLPSTSIVLVCYCKSASAICTANENPMGTGHDGTSGSNYSSLRIQTDEALDAIYHDGGGLVANNANLAAAYDTNWHMMAMKAKTNALAVSLDGSAWNVATPTFTFPNASGSAPNRFMIGDRGDGGAAAQNFNGSFLAAFAYDNLYDTADDTWIANLFSDPWQFLTTGGAARMQRYYEMMRAA